MSCRRTAEVGRCACSHLEEHGQACSPEAGLTRHDKEALETELKYAGVAARQVKMQARMTQRYAKAIPGGIDYAKISTLSLEAREKLAQVGRPTTQVACCAALTPLASMPAQLRLMPARPWAGRLLVRADGCTRVQAQPANVGQAARLGGVSPADIDSLLIHMEVQRRRLGLPRPPSLHMSTRQKRDALMAAAGQ